MISLTCYRLCVLASGSLFTDIFSCFTLIIVSCLHLGQNSGKFSITVSSRILTLVLLPQIGHNIHSYLHTLPSLSLMLLLNIIFLIPANIKLLFNLLHFCGLYKPFASIAFLIPLSSFYFVLSATFFMALLTSWSTDF